MKTRSLSLKLCLCIQFIAGCAQSNPAFQTKIEDSTAKPARKVVEIDWHAELAERQKQLERDPNSAFLHNQVAVAYDALGDFDNFDREIQTAIKLDPSNSIDCYVAYAVYKRRHLEEKGLSVLEKALQIDPANPLGHYEKAGSLEDAKEWQRALKEYETAQQFLRDVKSNPQNFRQDSWYYTDAHGNPYDVGPIDSSIANDIARVRAAPSTKDPRFSINIKAEVSKVKTGSDLRIDLLVTNTSDHIISLGKTLAPDTGEVTREVDVFDAGGKPAPQTKMYRVLKGKESPEEIVHPAENGKASWVETSRRVFTISSVDVKPGDSIDDRILLGKLFDFSKPGNYTVQVREYDYLSQTYVKSNTITVTIIP